MPLKRIDASGSRSTLGVNRRRVPDKDVRSRGAPAPGSGVWREQVRVMRWRGAVLQGEAVILIRAVMVVLQQGLWWQRRAGLPRANTAGGS
ncbi:unnamed protein product [Gadus morhua 'NCC']